MLARLQRKMYSCPCRCARYREILPRFRLALGETRTDTTRRSTPRRPVGRACVARLLHHQDTGRLGQRLAHDRAAKRHRSDRDDATAVRVAVFCPARRTSTGPMTPTYAPRGRSTGLRTPVCVPVQVEVHCTVAMRSLG